MRQNAFITGMFALAMAIPNEILAADDLGLVTPNTIHHMRDKFLRSDSQLFVPFYLLNPEPAGYDAGAWSVSITGDLRNVVGEQVVYTIDWPYSGSVPPAEYWVGIYFYPAVSFAGYISGNVDAQVIYSENLSFYPWNITHKIAHVTWYNPTQDQIDEARLWERALHDPNYDGWYEDYPAGAVAGGQM